MSASLQEGIQQEVWQTIRAINDCWTKGNPEHLINYFHKNMVAITPTDRNRLEGKKACVAGWVGFARAATVHYWREIDPQILLFGNTAVVTYYFDISFSMGGQTIKLGGRDMFVLVKEEGKWWAVADQFSPYPS